MQFKPWNDLSERIQKPEVRKYYDILNEKKVQLLIKRGFDVFASSAALAALSPLFAAIAIAIKLDSDGPVFFRQERITQFGQSFKIHKFRSMFKDSDKGSQVTVRGDSRITRVGEFIRKYKLDELSQLFDVFKGDMTFVGTRPEVRKYVDKYSDEMLATLLLPAGITSSASVLYRDENKLISLADDVDKVYIEKILPDKMKYNLSDIENFSLYNDFKILVKTALVLITGDRPIKREKPLVAVVTNNDDDIYCFRKELIEALKENDFDVLISCPFGEKFELLGDIDYIFDDPEIDRRGTSVLNDGKLFAHYISLFLRRKPDVILTYTIKPNIYASIAADLLNIPVINNVTGFGSILFMDEKQRRFIMRLLRFAFKSSFHVFFQNQYNLQIAEKYSINRSSNSVIPGSGVNTNLFISQPYPDEGQIVFNYIGRVLKEKGIDDYLKAAERIRDCFPNTVFNIIGFIEPTESHYEYDFKALETKGIIHYLGSKMDVKPYIRNSHATILPSYGEGMSNVLLESASSARPIITTDNPGCRETVIDGETGFIYPGGDVDALVETIERFLSLSNEEKRKMGERGREYVKENFSRDIVVKAYLDKIKEITGR